MGLTVANVSYRPEGDFESIEREIRLRKFKIGKSVITSNYQKIKDKIPESTLKKYSDYGSHNIFLWDRIQSLNLNYLISGDLEGIALQTIITPDQISNLKQIWSKRENSETVNKLIKIYHRDVYSYLGYWESFMNNHRRSKRSTHKEITIFAEYVPRVRKIQRKMHKMLNIIYTLHDESKIKELKYNINTQVNKLRSIVDTLIERIKHNYNLVSQKLQSVHFIEQDPQRQWTSSINPVMEHPSEFYGNYYESCWIGIPPEIETTLRLIRNFGSPNRLKILPKDLFNMLLFYLFRAYVFNPLQKEPIAKEPKFNLSIQFEEPVNIFYKLIGRPPHHHGTLKYYLQNLNNEPNSSNASVEASEDDLED